MKVKALELKFTTAKQIAEYYLNREFSTVPLQMVKDNETGLYDFLRPSDSLIAIDYIDAYGNLDELVKEWLEETGQRVPEPLKDGDFLQWVTERSEYEDYRYGDWEMNNEPMWGWVFRCPDVYIDSDYMNVDKLYQLGIGVIEHETGNYLFISGAGYDFYEAHWIPLFKELGWIKELKENK